MRTAFRVLSAVAGLAVTAAVAGAQTPGPVPRPAPSRPAAGVAHKAGEGVIEPAVLDISPKEKVEYELGTLYVPENRAEPKSRIIGVGFARFKALKSTGAPPTFHLPNLPERVTFPLPRFVVPGFPAQAAK